MPPRQLRCISAGIFAGVIGASVPSSNGTRVTVELMGGALGPGIACTVMGLALIWTKHIRIAATDDTTRAEKPS